MRILVTAPYFYPRIGGMEAYAYNISTRLAGLSGEPVVVLTSQMSDEVVSAHYPDSLHVVRTRPVAKVQSTPVNPLWPSIIAKVIGRFNISHVITHTPVPYMSEASAIASILRRLPFVVTYHDDIVKREAILNASYGAYYRLFQRRAFVKADALITTSNILLAKSRFIRDFSEKTSIIPPGVDSSRFNPDINELWLSEKLGLAGKRLILFVGQMHRASTHKGVDVLLRAFSEVNVKRPDTHLILVGDGEMRSVYEGLARTLLSKESFSFVGIVSENEMPFYYRGAEITILPSVTSEGFGMALLEANACGRPAIGTTVGGIPAAVQDGATGILTKPGSHEDITKAVIELLDNTALAHRMGRNGRERVVREFDWKVLANRTFETLLRIET